jgi:hypothetical protein
MGGFRRAGAGFVGHRHTVLLLTLLLTLVAAPLQAALGLGGTVMQLLLALSLVTAVLGLSERPAIRIGLLVVSIPAVLLWLVPMPWIPAGIITAAATVAVSLVLPAAAGAVRFAFRGRTVDWEHIAAALSAYVIAGFVFGAAYLQVELYWPGSILVGGVVSEPGTIDLGTTIYFSFVTLATLGYGDVVPLGGVARGLAIVEALGAQIYLVVMVSRLVSMQVAGARPSSPRGDRPQE